MRGVISRPSTRASIQVSCCPGSPAESNPSRSARIPKRVDVEGGIELPKVDDALGEVMPLEEPQVAGARCRATNKLIAFENDARVCGRCSELYHKDSVPKRCLTCDARLKA